MNRDNITIDFEIPMWGCATLKEYVEYYNAFAMSKSLGKIDECKLKALTVENGFCIGTAKDEDGNILVRNGYIVSKKKGIVSLYSSSSRFRDDTKNASKIGRANGLLQYKTMEFFREKGFINMMSEGFIQVQKIRKK